MLLSPSLASAGWNKLWSSSLWSLFSFLLGPNIRLRIIFLSLSPHSALNERDHVSQPHSTTGNIVVLYVLIFKLLERIRKCLDWIITEIYCPKTIFYFLVNRILICHFSVFHKTTIHSDVFFSHHTPMMSYFYVGYFIIPKCTAKPISFQAWKTSAFFLFFRYHRLCWRHPHKTMPEGRRL